MTAATRSPRCICHRQRSDRSPRHLGVQRFIFYRCKNERQRRKKKVDTSCAAITNTSCDRVVKGHKFTTQNSVGGFLNRRFKQRFWVLLPLRAKVPRGRSHETLPLAPGRKTPPAGGRKGRPYAALHSLYGPMRASAPTKRVSSNTAVG